MSSLKEKEMLEVVCQVLQGGVTEASGQTSAHFLSYPLPSATKHEEPHDNETLVQLTAGRQQCHSGRT